MKSNSVFKQDLAQFAYRFLSDKETFWSITLCSAIYAGLFLIFGYYVAGVSSLVLSSFWAGGTTRGDLTEIKTDGQGTGEYEYTGPAVHEQDTRRKNNIAGYALLTALFSLVVYLLTYMIMVGPGNASQATALSTVKTLNIISFAIGMVFFTYNMAHSACAATRAYAEKHVQNILAKHKVVLNKLESAANHQGD